MKPENEPLGRECPEDGGDLLIRHGRYGKFIGCSNFPSCRYTEPWLEKIGVRCPQDGGELVERHTRRGRIFFGCANYPACDFTSWKRPLSAPCPTCGGLLVVENKKKAEFLSCHSGELSKRFPSIEKTACLQAMHLVLPDGAVLVGERAAPEILRRLRRYRWCASLFGLPGAAALSRVLYRWFARHRHRAPIVTPTTPSGS